MWSIATRKPQLLIMVFFSAIFSILLMYFLSKQASKALKHNTFWHIQSIDTMKYSRDFTREKLTDASFDKVIDTQISHIAQTGATHVAIATPYDDEFLPFLLRWVSVARNYNLNVWFRGNFSGWEQWFGYDLITRSQHTEKLDSFIRNNPDLFVDGDVLSTCPECENGGPGDPRQTGDIDGHRKFLITEYETAQRAFSIIGKDVDTRYNSMNGDVAKSIFDDKTAEKLGGLIVIDHYVATDTQTALDIKNLAQETDSEIMLGEFGVPVPDIHGNLTEKEQSAWLLSTLTQLIHIPQLIGINYWTSVGGSTQLWSADGNPREAVEQLTQFFKPDIVTFTITNELDKPIDDFTITYINRQIPSNNSAQITLPYIQKDQVITIRANGSQTSELTIRKVQNNNNVVLKKENPSVLFQIRSFLHKITL